MSALISFLLFGLSWSPLLQPVYPPPAARPIVVAPDGSGDYKTIQAAIESVSPADSSGTRRTIFIKNGVYREKIFIDKRHFLTLRGQSEKGVRIVFTQARDVWRCSHPDDYGAATLNINARDLTFENLSVINDYGFLARGDTTIQWAGDAGSAPANPSGPNKYALPREAGEVAGTKIVRKDGHQMAFRSMPGAVRLIVKHCTFRALGGDTVSPWDVDAGMYYFKACTMEGGVDFYCPRGWAYAENCRFICHNKSAAIWHDGSKDKRGKTVLKNCTFEGDDGFKLGRFHREAQFYLIGCRFARNMADADIYWVTTAPNPINWGRRVYYQNCHHDGGDYTWHRDNLPVAPSTVTVAWTFDGKWHPE